MSRRNARSGRGTVSIAFVLRMIEAGVAAGVDRDVLLAAARLTDADLADQDQRVPLAAEAALWRTLAERVSDPGFGVRMGANHRLQRAGLFGYVIGFSATLGDAMRRVPQFGRVYSDASRWRIEGRPNFAISLDSSVLGRELHLAEDYRQAAVVQGCREITGVDIIPVEVAFTQRQPANTIAHREFFRSPLKFGAPRARVAFRALDVDLPVVRADETLVRYLTKHAQHELTSMRSPTTTRDAVRAAIWSVSDRRPTVQRVAAALGTPARTLQRRLAAEGTTFQREVDEILKSLAIASLKDHSVPIDDVASLLGYSEASAFHRSFKRWTGTTPRNFRRIAA